MESIKLAKQALWWQIAGTVVSVLGLILAVIALIPRGETNIPTLASTPTNTMVEITDVDSPPPTVILDARQAAIATLWTPTPNLNTTQILEAMTAAGITANADWTPIEQGINGVTMVYVPTGCFMMGSTDGENEEQPVAGVCITEPFWLDKTEVTQAQFVVNGGVKANTNGFTGENRPVERITWHEAEVYCREQRGGRLPTEAEWEFAARGPDGLKYPWGNEFIAENVVYNRSSSQGSADVGSKPTGKSWVGALDLSGNVWEWVSTLYQDYPYKHDDGRENLDSLGNRVLRGGSWGNTDYYSFRGAYRYYGTLTDRVYFWGFRCARPS